MAKPTEKPDVQTTTEQHQVNGARKASGDRKKPPPAKPYAVKIRFS